MKDVYLRVIPEPPIPESERCSFYDYMAMKELSDRCTVDPPVVSKCCQAPVYYSAELDENICCHCKKECRILTE